MNHRIVRNLTAVLVGAAVAGCTGGTDYQRNRLEDLADCVTFSVGRGFGAKVQAGVFGCAPLIVYRPKWGMHAGEMVDWRATPFVCYEHTYLRDPCGYFILDEYYYVSDRARLRAKTYSQFGFLAFMVPGPYRVLPKYVIASDMWETIPPERLPWYKLTDVNVSGGVFLGFRLGVNPGEFLDFLLGWCHLDIYGDDL